MKLTESKLRQIIIEEVADRLLEQIIEEELDKFLLENDLEDEDDLEDYKKAYKKDLISKVKKGLVPFTAAAALFGLLNQKTAEYADIKAAETDLVQQMNIEKNSTIERSVDELNKQAGNFFGWTWKTNDAQTLPFPTNPDNNSEAILPPEWSVVAQVAKDKAAGAPKYQIDQNYLKIAKSPEALASAYKNIKGAGSPEAASDFFDRFSPDSYPFSDASEMGAHSFMSNNPGVPSAMIDLDGDGAPDKQNLVYIPFDELPDDYVMPNSGLTKDQLYKQYYYGHGMSLEEFSKLKSQLKECKVSWKNYKNRQKKLA